MKYPWISAIIALLWIEATFTILSNSASNVQLILLTTAACTAVLAVFGFRSST